VNLEIKFVLLKQKQGDKLKRNIVGFFSGPTAEAVDITPSDPDQFIIKDSGWLITPLSLCIYVFLSL
jgi:hypothetical protein